MNIAFNALSALAGGGVSAFINLLPKLEEYSTKDHYIVFISRKQNEIIEIVPKSFKKILITYLPANPIIRVVWEQLIFPFYLRRFHIDVLYSVGNLTSVFASCKIVLFMENSNPYSKLKLNWPVKERIRNYLLRLLGWISAKRANTIRFASYQSKEILKKELCLPERKCKIIYHGINKPDNKRRDNLVNTLNIGTGYVLNVSVIAPHKNLEILIDAYKELRTIHNFNHKLVIVGNHCYPQYLKKLKNRIAASNLTEHVILTGKIEHKGINEFYINAGVFALTSIQETFCIPIIEAMSYGVPVIAPRIYPPRDQKKYFVPYFEICGDAARYFDFLNPGELADSIYYLYTNISYRKELIAHAKERMDQFTLDNTARSLINLFHK